MARDYKRSLRDAMRDGHSPSRATKIADAMQRMRSSKGTQESDEQGPKPEDDEGPPEEAVMDSFAKGGITKMSTKAKGMAHGHPGKSCAAVGCVK